MSPFAGPPAAYGDAAFGGYRPVMNASMAGPAQASR
jgi:hypothetical protein